MSSRSSSTSARVRLACAVTGVAVVMLPAGVRADGIDGLYLSESFGVASAAGKFSSMLGTPLHLRLAAGLRVGNVAIEPWILSDLQTHRDGATLGIAGGDPRPGAADVNSMGLDAKYIVPLERHVSLFARGGPMVSDGTGALAGYHGRGIGAAAGAQLTGKVRALGFLWAPLFFVDRGPMLTGALLIDAGYDFTFLRMADGPAVNARIAHVSVGFGVGSAF